MHPVCDLVIYSRMSDRTSLQQYFPCHRRCCISYEPALTLTGKWIICSCLHMSKGVFRSLTCTRPLIRKTCFSAFCVLLTSDYFVVTSALGKCIRVKVYILIRKCSGVKVKVAWNIKTQVKYRYSQKLLMYCNKLLLLHYNIPLRLT